MQVLTGAVRNFLGSPLVSKATHSMNKGLDYGLGRSTNVRATVADPIARREARMQQESLRQMAVLAEGGKGCGGEKGMQGSAFKGEVSECACSP